MQAPDHPDKLVSAERLRHYFDPPRSIRTIRTWQTQRIIPFIKVGRSVLFEPGEVRAYLKEHREIRPRKL